VRRRSATAAAVSPANVSTATGSKIRNCSGLKKKGTVPARAMMMVTANPETTIAPAQATASQPNRRWSPMRSVATSAFWST
jgi:hypothetical protein